MPQAEVLAPLAVAVAAPLVIFHHLDFSIWFDEAFSYGMAAQPWPVVFAHWIWGSDANMTLYYLILRGWLGFLGLIGVAPNEVLFRVPSALCGVAAVLSVYLLGRQLFGKVAGLVASGLFLTNFLYLIVAQSARAYTLGLLLFTISWLALFRFIKLGSRRWWVVYVGVTALSVYTLLLAGLIIASQAAAVVAMALLPGPWRTMARSAITALVPAALVTLLLTGPILVDAALHGGPNFWVPPATLSEVKMFLFVLTGQSRAYEYLVFALMGVGVVLAAAPQLPRLAQLADLEKSHLGPAAALVAWFAVPMLIAIALTQPRLNLHVFSPRYMVIIVPAMCLLAGLAVQAMPSRLVQLAIVTLLIVVSVAPVGVYYANAQAQDFKDPVIWMQQHYQTGDGVVCDPEIQCALPVAYYVAADPGSARFDSDSPGWFFWDTNSSVPVSDQTVLPFAARHDRVFIVYGPLGPDQTMDAKLAALEKSLEANGYRLADQYSASGSTVTTTVLLFDRG
ncbi:MAG TPA: glycosyltransferase family 39 protein [Candidatus Dormibacteraeota bacterium]|nr:glycosyltransferase family 39 protein [Candidatus Dormibacteraeota bacterium]